MMRKACGYWMDPVNVVAEANKIMEKEGWDYLPSANILNEHGYGSLAHASKHHGGFSGLRTLLDQEALQHPLGFWQDPVNVVAQARAAMEKEGWQTLPGATELQRDGYGKLIYASKFHGGMSGLRKLLSHEGLRRPNGFWQDPVNVVAEANKIMEKEGWVTLPACTILQKCGYLAIVKAAMYHGGFSGLRKLLGQERLYRPRDYWQDPLNVVVEAKKTMVKEGWVNLPSTDTLCQHGYSSLIYAAKYHGGMSGLRKLIAEHSDQSTEQEQLEVLVGGYDA